jgi:tetratricopeptide (TPR) repeat protein
VLGEGIRIHGKRRSPQLSELQYGMARIAQVAGDEEGRFAWLDAAMQSDRKNGAVASELALFCMERADYDNAIKALQLVTLLKEDCPMGKGEAYLRQAHIAEVRGDPRKAALLAKRALTAEPEYLPAKTFLDRLGVP